MTISYSHACANGGQSKACLTEGLVLVAPRRTGILRRQAPDLEAACRAFELADRWRWAEGSPPAGQPAIPGLARQAARVAALAEVRAFSPQKALGVKQECRVTVRLGVLNPRRALVSMVMIPQIGSLRSPAKGSARPESGGAGLGLAHRLQRTPTLGGPPVF